MDFCFLDMKVQYKKRSEMNVEETTEIEKLKRELENARRELEEEK